MKIIYESEAAILLLSGLSLPKKPFILLLLLLVLHKGLRRLTRQSVSPRWRLIADLKASQPFMAAKRAPGCAYIL